MNIAVTGNIGGGKSTVSKILANALVARLCISDEICRKELCPGRKGLLEVKRRWGRRFLTPSGTLDRVALRSAAFADSAFLDELEEILHPIVLEQLCSAIAESKKSGRSLVVEVPLLFEVGWDNLFDCTVVVRITDVQMVTRVACRDGRSREEIARIAAAQMPLAEKVQKADFCIDNSSFLSNTVEQVYWFVRYLSENGCILIE